MLLGYGRELISCIRDRTVYKARNIYCLALNIKYDNFCLREVKNVINFSNTRTQWELFNNFLLVGFPVMCLILFRIKC